jgi:hypothetical protein
MRQLGRTVTQADERTYVEKYITRATLRAEPADSLGQNSSNMPGLTIGGAAE